MRDQAIDALQDAIRELREDLFYYRDGFPVDYTFAERGIRTVAADALKTKLMSLIDMNSIRQAGE